TQWREINTGATHFEGQRLGLDKLHALPPAPALQAMQANLPRQIAEATAAAIANDNAQVLADAQSRDLFRAQALAAAAAPTDPSTEKAVALQALAPPPPPNRCGIFNWLCGPRNQ